VSAAPFDNATEAHLTRLLGTNIAAAASLGGDHGVRHYRLTLTGGRLAFAKIQDQIHNGNVADPATPARRTAPAGAAGGTADPATPARRSAADGATGETAAAAPAARDSAGDGTPAGPSAPASDPHGFGAEAASLRWLGKANAVPVPAVLAADKSCLVIEWVDSGSPTPAAAVRFGRDLADLHGSGSERFGAPWPGVIAGLPLPNEAADSWPTWYPANRLLPYARIARDSGTLSAADVGLIESAAARSPELAGPPEPPSRIHGDCWSGNVLWSVARGSGDLSGWLVDPAAYGGHRETDLAMLALFGAPYLERIMAAYQERSPLADGWRSRMPLHQLHPLLVHVCLFGASYRESALGAARAVLSA
jgi:fructosamine-3-kinase